MRLALVVLLAVAAATPAAAAAPTCTPGNKLDEQQQLLVRYIYELRNNRQTKCGPPDFVMDPKAAGYSAQQLCTAPGPAPGDTFANITVNYLDTCGKTDKERQLQVAALVRQCAGGQDPLLQPWDADSIQVKPAKMPANYTCPVGLAPIEKDKVDEDFTPMWEFDHLLENAVKYKLAPADPSALPACGGSAWLSTSMDSACFDPVTGRYEGYGSIDFSCINDKEKSVQFFVSAVFLGRENCPWPMILNGSDGYNPAFDFTNQTLPLPGPEDSDGAGGALGAGGKPNAQLAECLSTAGVAFVDAASNALQFQQASQVWNKMNNTVPAAVAYPANTDQVAAAVLCAKQAGIKPVPRSGGHSYMGYSVMPGQLTVSLNLMNSTKVSADRSTAVVQTGSRLGQLYYNVWDQTGGAKAAVGGTCPPVGTAGLLSGGGIGFLTRQYGLACDQILALKMVDAEGKVLTADANTNKDLLAAACGGGGGNFGIMTEYTLQLVDVPAKVTIVEFNVGKAQALAFLKWMQTVWVKTADPRLGLSINVDKDGVDVTGQFQGSKKEAAAALAEEGVTGGQWKVSPTYKEKTWIDSVIYNAWYDDVKQPSDLLNIAAMEQYRPYFKLKSFFAMEPLPDGALLAMMGWVTTQVDNLGGYIEIDVLGPKSAVAAVPPRATGFVHRGALYSIQYGIEWRNRKDTDTALSLVDALQAKLNPYFSPNRPAYFNYLDVDIGPSPLESYLGDNLGWLQALKGRVDPTGLFTANPLALPAPDAPLPTPAAPEPVPTPPSSASKREQAMLMAALAALFGLAVLA